MPTEIGEYAVGAYLREVVKVDFVNYNVRPPGGGLRGLEEIDVVGLHLRHQVAYLCEVTTHIRGAQYGTYQETVARVAGKHKRLQAYATSFLRQFRKVEFMFWSPVVPSGVVKELKKIEGLQLVINLDYSRCIQQIRALAAKDASTTDNPFYRTLQILERLRQK